MKSTKPVTTATTPVIRFSKDNDTGYTGRDSFICRVALSDLFTLTDTARVRCKLIFSTRKMAKSVCVYLRGWQREKETQVIWGRVSRNVEGETYGKLARFLFRSGFEMDSMKPIRVYVRLVKVRE